MNPGIPDQHGASLRSRFANGWPGVCLVLVLAWTGTSHGAGEAEPKEPKQTPAKQNPAKKTLTGKGKTAPPTAGLEGTSSDHPNWPLALWSDGPAVQWRAQAYASTIEIDKLLVSLEKSSNAPVKKRVIAVGRAHVQLIQLARLVARLRTWSEAAGVDLDLRHNELRGRLNPLVEDVRSHNAQLMYEIQLALRERCQKAEKQLVQIKKMREAGKLEAAEARLIKLYDELAVDGAWYPQLEANSPLYPFEVLLQNLTDGLFPERRQEGATR